jgi:hypothetical protein
MFAAAVYPLLLGTLASRAPRWGRYLAIVAGGLLALLIGASRVVLGAHSVSEVLAGLLLGASVSAAAMALGHLPRAPIGPAIPVAVALWLAIMPVQAPASRTHSMVAGLSLILSGHKTPYTRSRMSHRLRRPQSAPGEPSKAQHNNTAGVALQA